MSTPDNNHMQQAFQDFMLGNNKKNKSKRNHIIKNSPSPSLSVSTSSSKPRRSSSSFKHYQTILKAFHGTLVRDWVSVDDNLLQVVQSIANLRVQIHQASTSLATSTTSACIRSNGGEPSPPPPNLFRSQGYRCRHYSASHTMPCDHHLTTHDVQLALSYALLQHERMLAGVRKLLPALGDAQAALGRRLEELLLHHYQEAAAAVAGADADTNAANHRTRLSQQVEDCQEIYKDTANELFRKQLLADELLESFLEVPGDKDNMEEQSCNNKSPRKVASDCANLWPRRGNAKSFLCRWESRLQELRAALM